MRADKLLADAEAQLAAAGIHNNRQEAGWILAHVAGTTPLRVDGVRGRSVDAADAQRFRELVRRRLSGEPLQYVLGSTEFYGLELLVGPGVLIPRPETERLVDFALDAYSGGVVCDVCTGSGAIVLALASRLGAAVRLVGVDISSVALDYARRNRDLLALDRVDLVRADLLSCMVERPAFGLITANPPYVSPGAYAALPADVRDHEPRLALYAAEEGLAVVRALLRAVASRLKSGGAFLCEISSEQGVAAAGAARDAGYACVEILRDYTGRDRVLKCLRP